MSHVRSFRGRKVESRRVKIVNLIEKANHQGFIDLKMVGSVSEMRRLFFTSIKIQFYLIVITHNFIGTLQIRIAFNVCN